MNEEIAEVVPSFQSNSILQMKLLDEIAKCPGHPNLQLILLENVVIDRISMLQPGVTDADARVGPHVGGFLLGAVTIF